MSDAYGDVHRFIEPRNKQSAEPSEWRKCADSGGLASPAAVPSGQDRPTFDRTNHDHRTKADGVVRRQRLARSVRRYAPRNITLAGRLDYFVQRGAPDECWPWSGFRDRNGYGRITHKGVRHIGAHRVALEQAIGPLPPGAVVMHSCDNPPCCNPGHLSAGTRIDNNADAKAKGRHAHGVTSGSAKLTDPEIIAIRGRYADGETAVSLAKEYGVSDREIGGIARGEKWPHVGGRISPKRRPRKASGGAR